MTEVPYILAITAFVIFGLRRLSASLRHVIGPPQIFAAAMLPVVGYLGVPYALFALIVIALIVIAPGIAGGGLLLPARQALDLRARLFMFCLPLMPMLQYTLMISGLTFFQFTFVNLLSIGFIIAMIRSGAPLRVPDLLLWDLAFLIMLVMQIVMDARGQQLTFALRACVIVAFNLGIPYLAISRACFRSESPGTIMLACIASCCIVAVIAGFESHRHWLLYDNLTARLHADPDTASGYAKQRGGLLRAKATWSESTGLSLFFGLQLAMLIALRKLIWPPRTVLFVGGMLFVGVFFTFARVGYVALIFGLLACFFYERRWKTLGLAFFLIPLAAVVAMKLAQFVPALAASLGMASDADNTVDYRSDLLHAGLALLRSHALAGMSMPDINHDLDFLRQGEGIIDLVNQPLIILLRSGLPGGAAYYAILCGVLVCLWLRSRRLPLELRAPGGACFAALIGLTLGLVTTSYGRNETSYVILLAFGVGIVCRGKHSMPVPRARPEMQTLWRPADRAALTIM